jgi:CBS domain-containing protein
MITVADVMSTDVVSVDSTANVIQAVSAMSAAKSGSVLVLNTGSLVGIFTERDVMRALEYAGNADRARVSTVDRWMSEHPVTVDPTATVADALNQMLFGGFRHLPVVEGDRVVGVVSMRDLARSLASG